MGDMIILEDVCYVFKVKSNEVIMSGSESLLKNINQYFINTIWYCYRYIIY